MPLARTADRLHRRLRSSGLLQRFTLFCRTLLVLAFVAPGLTKVLGVSFIGVSPPPTASLQEIPTILAFFEVFHSTGAYYSFVGAMQVLAALLLLSRRTALLGAVLYFPIIANISVLTVATKFGPLWGTQLITVLMTLACLWLLLWDGHRLAPLLSWTVRSVRRRVQEPALWDLLTPHPAPSTHPVRFMLRAAYLVGFTSVMVFLLAARAFVSWSASQLVLPALLCVVGAGVLAVTGWALWWWTGKQSAASHAGAGRSAEV